VLAAKDARVVAIEHDRNRGKGAAIRTAIAHCRGDVAVIQDADLEYDPRDFVRMLEPILAGKADAVFGSRFRGDVQRVLFYWHRVFNRFVTTFCNMVNDLNLTDMEACYKMVRADAPENLRLRSNTFNIEPELTARWKQWGARINEVPISYFGRTYMEGKKISAWDGLKAVWEIMRSGVWDQRITEHDGFYMSMAAANAPKYHRDLPKKGGSLSGAATIGDGGGSRNHVAVSVEPATAGARRS
jgi:glycosyltransferase involved in cell wall biosynthesis